ncbi:MAG: DUF1343 domain-containing protein [Bacteroidota bacterium]
MVILCFFSCCDVNSQQEKALMTGSARLKEYMPLLTNKRVGLVVNQSSLVGNTHLVDTLISQSIKVVRIFAPEHGFRGEAADGITVEDGLDKATGVEVWSLYGKNKKPTDEQMSQLDIVLFDVQDVGTRFYTYLSTMHWVMEACAANKVPFIVLDRPNPNAGYVDGPILELQHQSIVGMHPIPVVHGMTLGELAKMINGEGWLADGLKCNLKVIPVSGWTRSFQCSLPVRPSPNLPDDQAVRWYPSLCFFEGTTVSVGRGTDQPFTRVGHPLFEDTGFSFVPRSRQESVYPKHENNICYGIDLSEIAPPSRLDLSYLIRYYHEMKAKNEPYFKKYFTRLAGTTKLQKQIEAGQSEEEIRASWQEGLRRFKAVRKQYLIYQDK